MIKINLITIGDIKEKYLKDAISEYSKRLSRFCDLKIIELRESISNSNTESDKQKALLKDAENIQKQLKGYVICLDINGKMLSSEEFSDIIQTLPNTNSEISFIIGASNGIHESIKTNAHMSISFSKMTFPHQLMRVIFLEQLYRGFTIIHNTAYHK